MESQPRTLLISPFFDAETPSGGVLFSVNVAREWLRRGRRVAVLCSNQPRGMGDLQPHLETGQLTLHEIVTSAQVRFTHHLHEDVRARTGRAIDAFRPDVIHVHNFQGMLSAIDAAIDSSGPVILTALDMGLLCLNFCLYDGTVRPCEGPESVDKCARCVRRTFRGRGGRLGPMLPRALTRRLWPSFVRLDQVKTMDEQHATLHRIRTSLDAIVALSPIVADRLEAFGTPADRIVSIPHSIPAERIGRPVKQPSDVLRLAYFGGLEPVKGLDVILEAASLLPKSLPLEIQLFGSEALRQRLKGGPAPTGRYVRYHPPVFGLALADVHARIDAVLVPSLCHENTPYVVLEALANGTVVIASDQAGIRHVVTDGHNGRLLPPGAADAWAHAMTEAARRPEAIRDLQPNARFTRTKADFVNDLCDLENSLLGSGSAKRSAWPARGYHEDYDATLVESAV